MRDLLRRRGGFADHGAPVILDENLSARGFADALRARGFNLRSVEEVFGRRGILDPDINQYAEQIGARVLTMDRGRQLDGGFGRLAVQVDARAARSTQALARLLEQALT
ncbi:MAG TPA: DUF5615 family PIN-like protein [Mycobacteriales bacterium]|nr:DUF5615 family PIN-like protein [Mycobacteriales bacterium]